MNYQYVFHGVEQDAPASLRVREREGWPIEGGRAHTHRGSAFGAFGAFGACILHTYAELRTRRLCSGTNDEGTRKKKEK